MAVYKESITDIRDFGCVGDGVKDNWNLLQTALNNGYTHLYVPHGYWRITQPLVIPSAISTGRTVRIFGTSNAYSIIVCDLDGTTYESRGALEYKSSSSSWGIVLEHLQFYGNIGGGVAPSCHAILLKQISYPLLKDVQIQNFKGAGLLLDLCQDGEFENLNIQKCGRTSGDPTNPSQTTYSALHLTNTSVTNDSCNMLRFNSLQCEQNNTSPYVSVRLGVGTGPIGICFSQVHSEVRDGSDNIYNFFEAEGGDFNFDAMALSPKFKWGFTFKGYGNATFVNSRDLQGVRHTTANVNAGIFISACQSTGKLESTGISPGWKVDSSVVGDVTLNYSGAGNSRFANCDMGNVRVINSGGTGRGVYALGCTMISLYLDGYAINGYYAANVITGSLTCNASNGRNSFVDNLVLGTTSIVSGNYNSNPSGNPNLLAFGEPGFRLAAYPAATDPEFCRLEPLKTPSSRYTLTEAQKLFELVNRLQILLNAEIARRKDLEARLVAVNVLSRSVLPEESLQNQVNAPKRLS